MDLFVEFVINGVLERSETARKQIGHLLSQLVIKKILLKKQYVKGLQNILQFAGDLVVDIPKVWDYFGELIGNQYFILFIRIHCILLQPKLNDIHIVKKNVSIVLIFVTLHKWSVDLSH